MPRQTITTADAPPLGIAVNGGEVYWADGAGIWTAPVDGSDFTGTELETGQTGTQWVAVGPQ